MTRTLFDTQPITLRQRVQACLDAHPDGLTDWEITAALGLPDRRKPSVAKRRQECGAVPMADEHWANGIGGLVIEQTVRTRPSPDGQPCIVWVAR